MRVKNLLFAKQLFIILYERDTVIDEGRQSRAGGRKSKRKIEKRGKETF